MHSALSRTHWPSALNSVAQSDCMTASQFCFAFALGAGSFGQVLLLSQENVPPPPLLEAPLLELVDPLLELLEVLPPPSALLVEPLDEPPLLLLDVVSSEPPLQAKMAREEAASAAAVMERVFM